MMMIYLSSSSQHIVIKVEVVDKVELVVIQILDLLVIPGVKLAVILLLVTCNTGTRDNRDSRYVQCKKTT